MEGCLKTNAREMEERWRRDEGEMEEDKYKLDAS